MHGNQLNILNGAACEYSLRFENDHEMPRNLATLPPPSYAWSNGTTVERSMKELKQT